MYMYMYLYLSIMYIYVYIGSCLAEDARLLLFS